MWLSSSNRQDNESSSCWADAAAETSHVDSLGTISDKTSDVSSALPRHVPSRSFSASPDLPATVQPPKPSTPRPGLPTDRLKRAAPLQPCTTGLVHLHGQCMPLQYIQMAYRQAVWDWPQQNCHSCEHSHPKCGHVYGQVKGWSAGSAHVQHGTHPSDRYNLKSSQPRAIQDKSRGKVLVRSSLAILRLPDDVTVLSKCQPRPGTASRQVTAAVFAGDAVGVIMQHLSRSDLAAMRLTCRSWKEAVSTRVRSLTPRALPQTQACPLLTFPAVSSIDLTAVGPQRMRTLSRILRGHLQQLTGVSLGDQQGRASWITNMDMLKVARMTSLRQLSLLCPKAVNVLGFSYLKALKNLEDLRIVNLKCIAESLPVMCSAWPKLTRLAAIGCKGSIRGTGSPCCWPQNLKHVHVAKESVAVLGLSDLAQLPALRHLVVAETSCPLLTQPQGIPQLTLLTGLTSLSLNDVIVRFDAIRAVLVALTGLSSLALTSTDVVPRQCEGLQNSLSRLPCLRDLVLTGLDVAWTILLANVGLTSLTVNMPDLPHLPDHEQQAMLSALPAGKEVPTCGRKSRLVGTLRLLLPRLPQLQQVNLLVPTHVQVVQAICFESANLAVACLQDCCTGLQQHCGVSIVPGTPNGT